MRFPLLLFSFLLLSVAALAAPPALHGSVVERALVLTSFSILEDLARQVAPEEAIEVRSLVAAGQDAHQYQATGKDLREIKRAALVFQIGVGFDSWLSKAAVSKKSDLITVTDDLELRLKDPHVWQDPMLAKKIVQKMAAVFRERYPAFAEQITSREQAYVKQLEELDRDLKARFAKIPKAERIVITSHDAFGYFARAYDVQFAAPQSISTENEASAKSVARIIRQIRETKARALFVEELTNASVMRQIAKETGVKIGGTLYGDSLSKTADPAGTYLKLVRHNAETILNALK